MARKSLRQELGKKKPFESPEKEAMLNIARTSDQFQDRFGKLFREFGLTGSQHNVLRILRGEGRPMRCDEIRRRMIQVVPGIIELNAGTIGGPVLWFLAEAITPFGLPKPRT